MDFCLQCERSLREWQDGRAAFRVKFSAIQLPGKVQTFRQEFLRCEILSFLLPGVQRRNMQILTVMCVCIGYHCNCPQTIEMTHGRQTLQFYL